MSDENTYTKDQTAQLVFNAEIKKDITALITSISTLGKNLDNYAAQYMPRGEVTEWKTESEKVHEDLNKRMRFIERYVWGAIGALAVLDFGTQILPLFHVSLK
jgi:hypothetical protein